MQELLQEKEIRSVGFYPPDNELLRPLAEQMNAWLESQVTIPTPYEIPAENIDSSGWEDVAIQISHKIHDQGRHWPHWTLLDPMFVAPDSGKIVSYTHGADSGIWTGHYLAAEAYRFQVTRSPEALDHIQKALFGLRGLLEVTGTGLLARIALPKDSPYLPAILHEEGGHGIYQGTWQGQSCSWIGGTSRDQYSGVLFGLAVAYDLVDLGNIREDIRDLVTQLLNFLLDHHWVVLMPDGRISTVFIGRPDQQLTLLQIGRHIHPEAFEHVYQTMRDRWALFTVIPIGWEVLDDHHSYFKFNLDSINLFNLIRLEPERYYRNIYRNAYKLLRRTTVGHQNAHFNMLDCGIGDPDPQRDANTLKYLSEWLQRPLRDDYVDLTQKYPMCAKPDRSCVVIPDASRVRTDFLWQRSPFLLYGGGKGTIERAGVDFILPYWMARYYKLL